MNSNLPQVKKEGIFIKIKNWFSNFFKKKNSIEDIPEEMLKKPENKTDFINNLKVENKDRIFMLQAKIKDEQMKISELTNQELDELIELYKEQIQEKKVKLKQYRTKIIN